MISKKISDFAKAISFTVKDDSAYGFIDNFLISIFETGSKKSFFVYYKLDETATNDNDPPISIMTISGCLEKIFTKYEVTEYTHSDCGLEVRATLPFKSFYSLIVETIKVLSSINAIKRNVCSECKKEIFEADKRFRLSTSGINYLLCENCSKEISGESQHEDEETEEEVDTTVAKGSLVKGILGSFLFALGVSVCIILLYAFAIPLPDASSSFKSGYYVNWLTAFMAFASFFGYKIFSKGTVSNTHLLISGGISLFVAVITQYISSIVLFSRESVFIFENLTFERFTKMIPSLLKIPFTDSFTSPDFKIYLLMDIIFVVVALLVISFFTSPKTESVSYIEEI